MVASNNDDGLLNNLKRVFSPTATPLGKTWTSSDAQNAFSAGEMNSLTTTSGSRVRAAFRNNTNMPLVMCWVDPHGKPYHFYRLAPTSLGRDVPITSEDHVETTRIGDSFVLACFPNDDDDETLLKKCRKDKLSLSGAKIVTGYRPEQLAKGKKALHLVTISQRPRKLCGFFLCPYLPSPTQLFFLRRGDKKKKDDDDDTTSTLTTPLKDYDDDDWEWMIHVQESQYDPTPFDTSTKPYETATLGSWPVRLEHDWHAGDKTLQEKLERDLQYAYDHLPDHARTFLQSNTPLWVNKTIQYGPKACPIKGQGLCFHPDLDWVKENGLTPAKHLCIELNSSGDYYRDSKLWGTGGVMIHELSHAYHFKMLEGGYDNIEIKECYEQAMKEELYECVQVHGRQGPTAKAYACENCMEYFAELSSAFLGGIHGDEEYNKWYPFNRKQIKEHDPRAYELLKKIWKVTTDDE